MDELDELLDVILYALKLGIGVVTFLLVILLFAAVVFWAAGLL